VNKSSSDRVVHYSCPRVRSLRRWSHRRSLAQDQESRWHHEQPRCSATSANTATAASPHAKASPPPTTLRSTWPNNEHTTRSQFHRPALRGVHRSRPGNRSHPPNQGRAMRLRPAHPRAGRTRPRRGTPTTRHSCAEICGRGSRRAGQLGRHQVKRDALIG
jgi:hypothetical protein